MVSDEDITSGSSQDELYQDDSESIFESESEDELQLSSSNLPFYTKTDKFQNLITTQRKEAVLLKDTGDFGEAESLLRVNGRAFSNRDSFEKCLFYRQTIGCRKIPSVKLLENFIPNSRGEIIQKYSASVYSGQFSYDGTFFYNSTKDFKVGIYHFENEKLVLKKQVQAGVGQWTITDASLSNDNRWLAYSTINPVVYITKSDPEDPDQFSLDFIDDDSFGIWSLSFSSNGKELIAGSSYPSIMIMDIQTETVVFRQTGHRDDVNAVCFSDPGSQILFSGSDDGLIKVWDRRSMQGEECVPAGVLVGHTSGITYVSSKRDGRYCLSNGKDQTMKLWDIRRMISVRTADSSEFCDTQLFFDYRWMDYPFTCPRVHNDDHSVMTYTGHKIKETLIRCHFSPAATTGQRYLYTGSADGKVYIYNLAGDIVQTLDSSLSKKGSDLGKVVSIKDPPEGDLTGAFLNDIIQDSETSEDRIIATLIRGSRYSRNHPKRFLVRDASWHPYSPYILSSCWEAHAGKIVKHTYTTT